MATDDAGPGPEPFATAASQRHQSSPRPGWVHPELQVVTAIIAVQVGAAFAKDLFDEVTPTQMTWLRLVSSSLILLAILGVRGARPVLGRWSRRGPSLTGLIVRTPSAAPASRASTDAAGGARVGARHWALGLAYAGCLVGMNWAIYQSFARIPLGIAVTIEFLGPMTVAALGSRRASDLVWVGLAACGVAVLGFSPTSVTWQGVGFALIAGACWAGYIVLGNRSGGVWDPTVLLTFSCVVGAVALSVPAMVIDDGRALLSLHIVLIGAAVGLLSSVIPYSLELRALRWIRPAAFSILMSLEPAAAALAAWLLLREALGWLDWVAVTCVVIASVQVTRRRDG